MNQGKIDENDQAVENESNQNNEFEQQIDHEDNATQNENDTFQTVQRLARQKNKC